MDIAGGAVRVITRTADATTAAAGAVGGAAITGVIGGVQGTVSGIRNGIGTGSHSTAMAAMTLGAIGAAGLVEWPVLLTIGGAALVVHQLSRRSDGQSSPADPASLEAVADVGVPRKSAPRKSTPRKSSTSARRDTPAQERRSSSSHKLQNVVTG
jgi:hypothetical protein